MSLFLERIRIIVGKVVRGSRRGKDIEVEIDYEENMNDIEVSFVKF